MKLRQRIYAERRAVIAPLGVFLIANVATLALGVIPLERSVAGQADARVAAKAELAEALKLDKQAKDSRASKERAEEELAKFYADILPRQINSAVNITSSWLHRVARESGVTLDSNLISPEQVRDSSLVRVAANVTLRGQYANIRRFLYVVETAQEFVIIEKVGLSESSAAQGSGGGMLELELDVSTYFVTKAPAP